MNQQFDAIVIGSGPGGIAASTTLAAGGKKVAVIESRQWGGTCLNRGCMPTKIMLGATAPAGLLHSHRELGVLDGDIRVDYAALHRRVDAFIKTSADIIENNMNALNITRIQGSAVCKDKGTLLVHGPDGDLTLSAPCIVLALGTESAAFPGLTPDGDAVLDSTAVLRLPEVPESLIVVGAGAIGMELGDFFDSLGTRVTIVEAASQLAPTEDTDIAEELRERVIASGRTCHTGVKARSLTTENGKAVLTLEDGTVLTAEKALVAVGRKPNITEEFACEKLGCTRDRRGYIVVDEHLQAAEGVYAVGDVNGLTLLAHAARHQGVYVARRELGRTQAPYASGPVPSCIYGRTEVMRVGKTAKELAASGAEVHVSRMPLKMNGITQANGDLSGFVKAVWNGSSLAGIAAVGNGVSHLVTAAQLLVADQYTPERMPELMVAHPTLDGVLPLVIQAPRERFA